MGYFLNKGRFFKQKETFSNGHGVTTDENRRWEDAYRGRWQHDKIVRSTHGVNCTGSCSWKIYVKNGIVTWETQQTDYPQTRPDLPNHEPRGCARGASYSWYLYSANRVKFPLVRGRLIQAWRDEMEKDLTPVKAWSNIQNNEKLRKSIQEIRGHGGFVRSTWDEVNDIIVAANIYTIKEYGPDRVVGFSPIPAMSMLSYAAGSRYLSLIGGVSLSFYDWYCDLPPSSPQTWGEQTDVPESADWYNSNYLIMWGSNVPQTRTPDAHFMTEVRYKGAQTVTITPDYSEASKFADIWLAPKQGTDAALAMAMGHVMLKEFYIDNQTDYFEGYARLYTDLPHLVCLKKQGDNLVPDRFLRASDLAENVGENNNPEWKTLCFDENSGNIVAPKGSIGFRWGEEGRWNLEPKDAKSDADLKLQLTNIDTHDDIVDVSFPYFGGVKHEHFQNNVQQDVLQQKVPVRLLKTKEGDMYVSTVFDLLVAHYGVDRGLGGDWVAKNYDDNKPFTPAWQEQITGVPRDQIIHVARGFADNAAKTKGRSMVIVGAAMNHWYHMDMNYRGLINMLMLCGCCGQSGGGWAHYVGQEKLRPQTGWLPIAFGLDWARPPRQMNSTSFFYAHTDQWRYEHLKTSELVSPLANPKDWEGSLIDCNIRAEQMGWLPSAPQLETNPLQLVKQAGETDPIDYVVSQLKSGELKMSCQDPDNPKNWPRNMFVWRSNLLGSSGKGHEYFLKHLLGTEHGVQGKDLGKEGGNRNKEIVWHDNAPKGKLDLLITLDFRMSTTALYSDIVLPTASWYEKNDLNTSDMHPFIHPLSKAVDPVWESRSDWDIYKGLAKRFSELADGELGVEKDIALVPILHDTPGEIAQATGVSEWKKGECDPIPGLTMPNIMVVERDYPNVYKRFTSIGPLMEKMGNGGKGIAWDTKNEIGMLKDLHGTITDDLGTRAKMETDIQACDTVLSLAPETNGQVAVKAWESLSKVTGIDHTHLAKPKEDEKIRFRDIQAQPRKIISSPTWSGLEDEHVSYTSNYTNVHEFIPWRTLTGRQHFYQDHKWLRDFGEGFVTYKPPVDLGSVEPLLKKYGKEKPSISLNFITPHQKWGIHSTYTDNLLMLTLSRGGPIVWLSEIDAQKVGVEDNDWIEAFNSNGALVARAVVSQRVPEGMVMMYHAQEKIVNVPGSKITGTRGGIHNSVTRATLKPTHMIGGYAQLSWGFNYYGTVGSNRDEFVIIRKMEDKDVDWMDQPLNKKERESA
ncbi:MAG: nitrate reductase subunit alpha [Endozoicomonadaceae bacterium]|nr:nitrate reductase subunit alpha [Endozoicomonadaceae bacterium]